MTPEEPFSHYNSVCDLEEVVTLLDREQESGEQIGAGYPRTVVVYEVSNVQQHSYTPDTVHCVRFYDVILGHHSNSDLDEELDDLPSQCCVSPENGEIN
jgi:hypothetical protein